MSETNLTNLGYVAETTFGTTPSSALQLLRRTGGSITPNQGTTRSEEIRSDLRAGAPIRTSQMASGSINVEWSYGTFDDILAGMFMEDWASNVLVDGTTKKSYTFEEQFLGRSPADYMIYKGSRIASVSMDLAVDSVVKGSFGVMTATPSIAQATAGTGAASAVTSTEVYNCVDMVTTLDENSSALDKVVGVTVQFDRSLRAKRKIGALNPFDIGVGRLIATGTITQHFEDATLADAYYAFSDRSLDITLTDSASKVLAIEFPKIKYVGDLQVDNPGPDDDVLVTANWEAYGLATDSFLARLTRTP